MTISAEARSHSQDSEAAGAEGIGRPMIDMRVAKYAAVANMRVLSVADDMARQETNLVDPSRPTH